MQIQVLPTAAPSNADSTPSPFDALLQAIPRGALATHGYFTVHRRETDQGEVDAKNTVEYTRVDGAGEDLLGAERFRELETTSVSLCRSRILTLDELPDQARRIILANNSAPPAESSVQSNVATPAPPTTAAASHSDTSNGLTTGSPELDTAAAIDPVPANSASPVSDNNDTDKIDLPGPDTASLPAYYGPPTLVHHKRRQHFRDAFNRYSTRLAAQSATQEPSSPAPSLSSLTSPLMSSPIPTSGNSTVAQAVSRQNTPPSPLTPLSSSPIPAQHPTPEINSSPLFTPNTVQVWHDIDGGLDHGCSSSYRGPSASGTGASSQPAQSAHGGCAASADASSSSQPVRSVRGGSAITRARASSSRNRGRSTHAAVRRPVVVIEDSTSDADDESEEATPTHAYFKKRRF